MKIAIEKTAKQSTLITLINGKLTIFIDIFDSGDGFFTVFDEDSNNIANGYGKLNDVCSDVEKFMD